MAWNKDVGILGNLILGGLDLAEKIVLAPIDAAIDTCEKVELIATDIETEGKKLGYEKAATEYEKAFRAIEAEYKKVRDSLKQQKDSYNTEAESLIARLDALEQQTAELKQKLSNKKCQTTIKAKQVSEMHGIPLGTIQAQRNSNATLGINLYQPGILDTLYTRKKKKLQDATLRGYAEAKSLYEEKLSSEQQKLAKLKEKGNDKIKELVSLIEEILIAISNEEMMIADLQLLSQETI